MAATLRSGKPYIWVTWLSGLLGGKQCLWSAWFKAHYKYQKFEAEAANLVEWNRDHNRLMRDRRQELEEAGWTVMVEDQNAFKLEGEAAVLAGKPDIVATLPGRVLIVDGKTGRERDSDIWQVFLYLFALPFCRPDLMGMVEGEVQYKTGDRRISVTPEELTPARRDDIVQLIKLVGASQPPSKAPSHHECFRCNIGAADCPERFSERTPTPTQTAAAGF